ncbi:MAG TPA: site-2 protease family protein [Chloroflexota bacterium]|jgi:Zn-dependent protease/CBS domain-containing protein|nr:site-2 protease family protein [Chloroflexota bacterium]
MPGTVWIGRLLGVRIGLHYSWLLIVFLLIWSLATDYFPMQDAGWGPGTHWILAGITTLLLFASVLAHEMGHALVARRRGVPVDDITLFLFGGLANLRRDPQSPRVELAVALAGPAVSLLLAGGFSILGRVVSSSSVAAAAVLSLLGSINLALGLFNLIPGFPLDGGRVLRAFLWLRTGSNRQATATATRVGRWISYGFIGIGLLDALSGDLVAGLWMAMIGWFLGNAAESSELQSTLDAALRGVPVSTLMTTDLQVVGPALSVEEFVTERLMVSHQRAFPVMVGANPVGLVTLADVRKVPRPSWPTTTVGQIMVPLDRLITIPPTEDCAEALHRLARAGVNQLLVVDAGRVVGMISRADLLRRLEIERLMA